jgi:MscS family membrane protein
MTLETLSARDTFWFHPVISLRHDTQNEQVDRIIDGMRSLLTADTAIDSDSVRVRFMRIGTFSLDIETFAYLRARDWAHFLEIQERLLLRIREIVAAAGAAVALPSDRAGGAGVFP